MKRLFNAVLGLLLIAVSPPMVSAQVSALFVNDNSLYFPNTELVLNQVRSAGVFDSVYFFNAVDSLRSPTYTEMRPYHTVIWYTSTDGVGRYFWSGTDADNTELILYMQDGGLLWVMGNDFLYDRYGSAPVTFSEGDFAYDYLGIETYAVQSYGDDGSLGVSQMDYIDNDVITNVPESLTWIYETLWWADGCTPNGKGIPFYQMGPDSYVLAGNPSALVRQPDMENPIHAISLFFDPALISNTSDLNQLFQGILDYISTYFPSSTNQRPVKENELTIYPNPASGNISVVIPEEFANSRPEVVVYNLNGQTVLSTRTGEQRITLNTAGLVDGMYFIQISDNNSTRHAKALIKH